MSIKRVGLLVLSASLASVMIAWVTKLPAPENESNSAASLQSAGISKPVTAELDENVGLNLVVQVSEAFTMANKEDLKVRRAVGISSVFDYGKVLSDHGASLLLVDADSFEPLFMSGGGADPAEAAYFAKVLLGEKVEYREGMTLPRWRVTVKPAATHTWGSVATQADIDVSWAQIPPKDQRK